MSPVLSEFALLHVQAIMRNQGAAQEARQPQQSLQALQVILSRARFMAHELP